MRLIVALFLIVALVALFFPEDSEAIPARRMIKRLRRPNARLIRPARRQIARRGRTNHPEGGEEGAPPAPGGADDPEGGEGGEGDIPDWCNPTKEMGAWLNYKQIRIICGERGVEDFGPYGGIPSEDEEAAEDAE